MTFNLRTINSQHIGRRDFVKNVALASLLTSLLGCVSTPRSSAAAPQEDTEKLRARLKNALDGGRVDIPAGRYILDRPLLLTGRGIKVVGIGRVDFVVARGDDAAFRLEGAEDVTIDGVYILAVNDCRAGISIKSCSNVRLSNITLMNYREAGVEIANSTGCVIDRSKFYNSAPDPRWQQSASSDVAIAGTNSNISVINCHHASDGGYAIEVRTNRAGERSVGHVISNNDINGYNSYGIMLYRNGPYYQGDDQIVSDIVIRDNVIRKISGDRAANLNKPGVKDFGAGIYLQGAESCTVLNNVIDGTNISTNTEMLSPGAIGLANTGSAVIRNNKISNCKYGVYINDSLGKGRRDGLIELAGNTFRSVKMLCVKIVAKDNVVISDSRFDVPPERFMEKSGGHQNKLMNNIRMRSNVEF